MATPDPLAALARRAKAREFVVEHGGHRYTLAVPLPGELRRMSEEMSGKPERALPFEMLLRFTRGWSLTELDFDPGGTTVPMPFHVALFADWVNEHPELEAVLFTALVEAQQQRSALLEADQKN